MGSLSDLIDELNAENKKLKEKVEELSTKIEEFKGKLKETSKRGIWKPKEGDTYWWIDEYGGVQDCGLKDENSERIGNCYPTEEKAEFEAQREKYTRLFRQYVEQHSEPLDWFTNDWNKWCVCYDYDTKEICYDNNSTLQYMGINGSSEEVMRDAVAFIGEENAKRYVIGVEENNGI